MKEFNPMNYRENLADVPSATGKVDKEKDKELLASEQNKKNNFNAFEEEINENYGNKELILKNLQSLSEAEIIDDLMFMVEFNKKRNKEKVDNHEISNIAYNKKNHIFSGGDQEEYKDIKVHFVPDTDNKVAFVEYFKKWNNSDAAKEYSKTHPEASQINEGEYRIGGIKIKNEIDYKKLGYENGEKASHLFGAQIDERDSKLPPKSAVKTTELDGTKMRVVFEDNTEISFDIKGILRNRIAQSAGSKLFPEGFDAPSSKKFFSKSEEIY